MWHLFRVRPYLTLNCSPHCFLPACCPLSQKAWSLSCHCQLLAVSPTRESPSAGLKEVTKQNLQGLCPEPGDRNPKPDTTFCLETLPRQGKSCRHPLKGDRITPLELSTRVLWHVGPPCLIKVEPSSSTSDEQIQLPAECLSELRSKDQQLVHGLLMAGTATRLSQMIDCKKFGSFERLISTTALLLKFCRIILNKVRRNNNEESCDLNAEAEHRWILECQELPVCDKKFEPWKRQLDLFQDKSGVWRCRGRIENAAIPFLTKHPALLHKDHPFTSLLVWRAHGQSSIMESRRPLQSSGPDLGLSRGEAWSRSSSNNVVYAEDTKGSHTVHHNHHLFPSSELNKHHPLHLQGVILPALFTSSVKAARRRPGFAYTHVA